MRPSRERRVVALVLRCYPERWRRRHGDEAQGLASALLDDGVSWWSIVLSYLGGAVRERTVARASVRTGAALAVLAIGVATLPLAVLTSLTPASASSANVVIVVSKPAEAARQLESAFAAHHFKLTLAETTVRTRLNGSILSVTIQGATGTHNRVVGELRGRCADGRPGCTYGVVLPRDFSGHARVTIGRAAP
jgi:hypothetical protein